MNPPEHVRVVLVALAAEAVPFVTAWMRALQSLPRGTPGSIVSLERAAWVEALRWSRPAWQEAYERLAPPPDGEGADAAGRRVAA